MLDGELEVLQGSKRRVLPAGELTFIPAGTVHTFANRGPAATRVLAVMTPEINALISALHRGGTDGSGETVWARYNSSVVPR